MARFQDVLSLLTAMVETFFLAGTHYGWPSMVEMLTKEGYFSESCVAFENIPESNLTFPTSTSILKNISTETLQTNRTSFNHEITRCTGQEESFNLVFSVSSSASQLSGFPFGILLDNFGTWVAKSAAISSVMIGLGAIAASTPATSWLLYIGLPLFVTGGTCLNRSNVQIANLFPKVRNFIITLLSSFYFASGAIFLILKTAYNDGISIKYSLYFLLSVTALSWTRTFFLMPKRHFVYPPPVDGQQYGILNKCKTSDSSSEKSSNDAQPKSSDELSINSGNENHCVMKCSNFEAFKSCLKTSLYWSSTFHVITLEFRIYFYFGTFNSSMLQLSGAENMGFYTSMFGIIVLCGSLITPLHGMITDFAKSKFENASADKQLAAKKAVSVSTILADVIALVMSVTASIPSLSIQIFVFITLILLRVFSLTNDILFLTTMYPVEQFGKLFGLHTLIFGLLNFLQAPLLKLILSYYEGDFTVVNVVFVGLCLLILIHPYKIYKSIEHSSKENPNKNSFA